MWNEGIKNIKIIAIGMSEYSDSNSRWTQYDSIAVVIDPASIPNTKFIWGAQQWDVFFLNSVGEYFGKININPWDEDKIRENINNISSTLYLRNEVQSCQFKLLNVYPNPFNPSTNIIFSIPQSSNSIISVYDVGGSFLETLYQSYSTPGNYTLTWNASDYPSGIYFIRLESDSYFISQKLVLAK